MKKFTFCVYACLYLASLNAIEERRAGWIPDSDKEFTSSAFNDWYNEKDCKSIGGTPVTTAECQGFHYPNDICCGQITQAKLLAFIQGKPLLTTDKKPELDAEKVQKNIDEILVRINQIAEAPSLHTYCVAPPK